MLDTVDELIRRFETHRPAVLLSICRDITRLQIREQTLTKAGFRVVSASSFQAAWAISEYCDFSVVVIDRECCSELSALVLKQRYTTVETEPNCDGRKLVEDLAHRFQLQATGSVH